MLHHVALVRTNILEENTTSIIRVTRIGEHAVKKYYFFAACFGC
jgi:hypothetical protein